MTKKISVNAKILTAGVSVVDVEKIRANHKWRAKRSFTSSASAEKMYALWSAEYDDCAKLLSFAKELRKRPSLERILEYLEINYIDRDLKIIAERLVAVTSVHK